MKTILQQPMIAHGFLHFIMAKWTVTDYHYTDDQEASSRSSRVILSTHTIIPNKYRLKQRQYQHH